MISFKQYLTEIHYTDIYPKDFHEFYGKWKKFKPNPSYWVNFTMHPKADILDRNIAPAKSRDHSDPAGLYLYSLKYAIDFPADIWYGRGARFLRVIQEKGSPNMLYLQSMSSFDISNFLEHMKLSERFLKAAKKRYGCNDKQAIFKLSQLANPSEFLFQKSRYSDDVKAEIKSGEEQTAFWQSLGYDGLIDEGKTQKSAIINDREPWQAVFFDKKYFKIVDIYELDPKSAYLSSGGLGTSQDEDKMKRKLAALIAAQIDDKVKEYSKEKAWTKKGRRIEVQFHIPQSYMDGKNMGEKPHKHDKKHEYHKIRVNIISEKEPYNFTWPEDTTFAEIAKEVGEDWKTLKDNPDFKPEFSRKEMEDKEKEERNKKYVESRIKEIKSYHKDIITLAEMYNVPWDDLTDDEWFRAYVEASHAQVKTNNGVSFDDYVKEDEEFWANSKSTKIKSKGADQMLALLDKIYHDDSKITVKKPGRDPEESTIAAEVPNQKIRHGWFSNDEYLIFDTVLKWKTKGVEE